LNGIVIDIDPMIAHLGPLKISWYSLFFVLATVAGVWLAVREARRKGLDADRVQSLAVWAVIGGLVGARLFHVADRWELYADHPLRILNIWEGGLAVYGCLIGGVLTGLAYAVRHGLPVWRLGDAAAPGMILGQAVGRLACIPNGDAYGAPTSLPWAFIYTNPMSMVPRELLGVPVHPYAAYELLFDLAGPRAAVAAAGHVQDGRLVVPDVRRGVRGRAVPADVLPARAGVVLGAAGGAGRIVAGACGGCPAPPLAAALRPRPGVEASR